ncbi:hypothetical protein C8R43DRAFT_1154953 [Mycena crocata]|nr:hypothetical protein C8R43DRAFT_1154953 [Mycena crocata]
MASSSRRQTPSDAPPPYNSTPARPPRPVCHGFDATDGCTTTLSSPGLCARHQEQGVWLHPRAAHISPAERQMHAESRRCCGLTKMDLLCNNNPGGNYRFCWRHGGQQGPRVRPARGPETAQRGVLRERFREFWWLKDESEGRGQESRDEWARNQQRRRERERERAESEQQERRRQQQQRDQEYEQERARSQRRQEEYTQWEYQQRSYQRQRPEETRNARERAQDEQRRREQRQREQEEANERSRRAYEQQSRRAGEQQSNQLRGKILERYLKNSDAFDATAFTTNNPNTFSRIPWPVLARTDGTIRVEDVTAENIRRFFDANKMRSFKTPRERDMILKKTAHRFHPDRFSANRPVIATIRSLRERNAVIEAADIVIKTVNGCRSTA